MSLLILDNVTQRFGGLTAVDSVSLRIEAGRVSAIIGPNGAGKTTLFNIISGFLTPTFGQVSFNGRNITGMPAHHVAGLGLVRTFQLVQLFADMSVEDNVRTGRHLRTQGGVWSAIARPTWVKRQDEESKAKTLTLLELVGLAHSASTLAGALPYGRQRLLEIARAMAAEPRLLLLDEPAAGLNPAETENLADVVRRIVERGTTVLVIEHDMHFVMGLAETIFVLDFGKKIAEGAPTEVQRSEAVLAAYLGGTEAVV